MMLPNRIPLIGFACRCVSTIFNIPVTVASIDQSEISLENMEALRLLARVRIPARIVANST